MYYRYAESGESKGMLKKALSLMPDLIFINKSERQTNMKFFAKTTGIGNEAEAHEAILSVLTMLSEKFAHTPYLFCKEVVDKFELTSFVDLLVYVHLKELISSAPNSQAVFKLKSDANLVNFMAKFENDLKSHRVYLPIMDIKKEDVISIGAKCIHKPMIDFPLGSRVIYKDEPDTSSRAAKVVKYGIIATIFAGLTCFNLASEPMPPLDE